MFFRLHSVRVNLLLVDNEMPHLLIQRGHPRLIVQGKHTAHHLVLVQQQPQQQQILTVAQQINL